jgi:AcrR family transcriptional regulator
MDNRALILERAIQLFAARGYTGVGVQEICEAAGVTKPTLYHYFGHKHGLLEALISERCAPLIAQVESAAAFDGDLPLTLRRVVEAYFRFATREPTLYRLLLMLWFAVPEDPAFHSVAALNERQRQLIRTLFLHAAARHGNMAGRQEWYAASFLGMINTYIVLALNDGLALSEPIVQQAVHQFSHGFYS